MAKGNLKIISTIEARMGATRLPGKVLLPVLGRPALELLIERLKRARRVDEIIVATTVNKNDEPIVKLCERLGVPFYRGSEGDVLSRVLEAAKSIGGDIIVEITGDCPLIDPEIVDQCIDLFFSGEYDYVSNILKRTYPRGLVVQVFPTAILEKAASLTKDPMDHEHVSLYIYNHPEIFRLKNVYAPSELHWPELALTLDTPEDYKLIKEVFERLYVKNPNFLTKDVIELFLRNPELAEINSHIQRKPVKRIV